MRGILMATLLVVGVVGTASSTYVAYQRYMEGRVDFCGFTGEQPEPEASLHRARLMNDTGRHLPLR
jgi:hypothetical protein